MRTLRNAVRQQRVAHAYLFTGPRGTGKTSTARLLAKAVNCRSPKDGNPCNECDTCLATDQGRAIDVIEIDAASNTSVDHVRELRERVAYAAGEAQYKVYIVDEVHRLSGAAFDAFLKTLEEPPPHVIFVFASTEPHKVPETITSRCQRFDFHRITTADTLQRLRYVAGQEAIEVRDDALRLIALHAHGSLRDALGMLDQVASFTEGAIGDADVRAALGLADATLVVALTEHLLDGALGDGLAALHRYVEEGGDTRQLTLQFVEYWRGLLLSLTAAGTAEDALDPALSPHVAQHAARVHEADVLRVIQAMLDQDFGVRINVPVQIHFELGYVQAALALRPGGPTLIHGVSPPPLEAHPNPPAPESQLRRDASPATPQAATEPDSSPTPSSSIATAGTSDIHTAWQAILDQMRAKSPSLQAVLRSGYLLGVQDGEITVGLPWEFHRNKCADPKNRKRLEEVVGRVLGEPHRVNCVHASPDEIQRLKSAAAVPQDDGFIDEVVERLRRYHAEELGNGHS